MEEEFYTINQVCEILQAPKHVIRRLLNNGLVRGIKRQSNHYRVLNRQQLELLRTFYYLSRSGMSMKELRKYSGLEYGGSKTIPERKAILETKRRQIWENLKDLQETIDYIERQIEIFDK